MNTLFLKSFAAGVVVLGSAAAHAYPNAVIINRAYYPARVMIDYVACRPDMFDVPGRSKTTGAFGKATAPGRRGGCLIRSISAKLNGVTYPVSTYTSSGTGNVEFDIWFRKPTNDYAVVSKEQSKGMTADRGSPEGILERNNAKTWGSPDSVEQTLGRSSPQGTTERKQTQVWGSPDSVDSILRNGGNFELNGVKRKQP